MLLFPYVIVYNCIFSADNSPSPFPTSDISDSPRGTSSRSGSVASSYGSNVKLSAERTSLTTDEIVPESPSTSNLSYKACFYLYFVKMVFDQTLSLNAF